MEEISQAFRRGHWGGGSSITTTAANLRLLPKQEHDRTIEQVRRNKERRRIDNSTIMVTKMPNEHRNNAINPGSNPYRR